MSSFLLNYLRIIEKGFTDIVKSVLLWMSKVNVVQNEENG
jgi:hypothetical protein